MGFVGGIADTLTAADDLGTAFQAGDTGAAAFYGLIMLGGIALALTPFGGPIWLAALGQSLELAGLIGTGLLQHNDLELWLLFCCFGRRAADTDKTGVRSWTDGYTLGHIAQSPRLQIECFGNLVYHMDISARQIDYDRLDSLVEISVKFAYCLPAEGQLFLRMEALRSDGRIHVVRPLANWSNATKMRASDKKTIVGFSDCFKASEVLHGVSSITVSLKLQVDQAGNAFFPQDKFISKTFEIAKLPHA
jgi:hypothetical protein